MKKHIILGLCIVNILNCMEQPLIQRKPEREPREWDAKAYDEGSTFQTAAFSHFLQANDIKTEDKTIFSIGCGTGTIESKLAEKATHIHAIDASKNMVEYARSKNHYIKNLSFEHCFAEDFNPPIPRQLVLSSFCLQYVEDKKRVLQNINTSLKMNGEFFATIPTENNGDPIELTVALEMISTPTLDWLYNAISGKDLKDLIGVSYPAHEELTTMLHQTGFDIIKCEQQSFMRIMNRKELEQLHWPIVSSRPLAQYIPDLLKPSLFQLFIDRLIKKLIENEKDTFCETFYTTIVHARKTRKLT